MFIYSQTIIAFLARTRSYTHEILREEMGITVKRNRFIYNKYHFPLNLVVFERKNILGFCDPATYQIGLHKSLMYTGKIDVIKNILRHELAHLFTYLQFGRTDEDHGSEFKKTCHQYGWGSSVSSAQSNIENENELIEGDLKSERIIQKIKKLLNLTSSSNPHEAELATIKANQLLLQYNLDCLNEKIEKNGNNDNNEDDDEIICVERVLQGKKNSAKYQAIYEILQSFLVRPVFNYGKGVMYLEITGTRTNVEIGRYVAVFLENELERLWLKIKAQHADLRGISSKNSFMFGVAKGYLSKIELMRKQGEVIDPKAIILLQKNLEKKISIVYGRLRKTSTSRTFCEKSTSLGKREGWDLSIKPGLSQQKGERLLLPRSIP